MTAPSADPSDGGSEGRPSVALVCTGVRPEEKMLLAAFRARGAVLEVVDDRGIHGDLSGWPVGLPRVDAVLLRAKSHWRNTVLARWLRTLGVTTVNPAMVLETCGDKVSTTLALLDAGVPTLSASVAFTGAGGLEAADALGYPLVVKPVIGSWGRLIGKVNDRDALETVLDHKDALGGAPHAVTYLQPYVELQGRDIRAFVIGGRCVAAIHRSSRHWKTNTHLGAEASAMEVDEALAGISEAAAAAVGGGAVAIDLFETDDGYVVNEVNGSMEFRNSVDTTGVDIPGLLAEYTLAVAATGGVEAT
ncbi:MAG: lysine biosynthesis protein LysX [Gemmatimonadota bacterium]|nr:lysine biosynthesis protein LysX [Gemmatimonadota bacterium]